MDSLRREKDPPVLEHGPCRHPLASLMASAMVLDDVVQVDCAAACGHRLYSDRGPLECPCHWPPGKAAQAAREFLRDPVHAGVSKERTFESSFVITVRQRRGKPKADAPQPRKSSSPLPTAHCPQRTSPNGSRPALQTQPKFQIASAQKTAENTTSKEINDRNVNNPPAPAKTTTTKCQRAWHMLPVLPARNTGPH